MMDEAQTVVFWGLVGSILLIAHCAGLIGFGYLCVRTGRPIWISVGVISIGSLLWWHWPHIQDICSSR